MQGSEIREISPVEIQKYCIIVFIMCYRIQQILVIKLLHVALRGSSIRWRKTAHACMQPDSFRPIQTSMSMAAV